MFINKQTKQYPVTEQQIRLENPNVSFSVPFYPPEDYAVVFPAPKPTYDVVNQGVRELQPVLTSKGHYEQVYEVYDLPEDVVLANQQQAFQQKLKQFDDALVNLFEEQAKSKRYDSRITCALRAGYAGPFQAEGQAFASWMDTCNALAYQILAEVQAGTRPEPANVEEFLALFPPITWPE
jgi:hypothetical protein